MAPSSHDPIVFLVPGTAEVSRGSDGRKPQTSDKGRPWRVKESARLGTSRTQGGAVRLVADPGSDVVVLHLANGPELVLHPETARDLMLAQEDLRPARDGDGRGKRTSSREVHVPPQLRWQGQQFMIGTRTARSSGLGDALLDKIEVVSDIVAEPAAEFAAWKVVTAMDGKVDEGVYRLEPAELPVLKKTGEKLVAIPDASGGPILVLVHGTFSTTHGTFLKLWEQHDHRVAELFEHYGDRVYALDHRTLGASPIANALTLANALPSGARLHLLTHSRGGLVAEVLARACSTPASEDFEASFGRDREEQVAQLKELVQVLRRKQVQVDRVVRVACPARGTLLASKRLDAYLSVIRWGLTAARLPVLPEFFAFLAAVAKRRARPDLLPGLEAQMPGSPLLRWLHAKGEPLPGELRVIAGDMKGDSLRSWLKTMLSDTFFWCDNDLVVQTRSMYGGTPRAEDARFILDRGGDVSHFQYFGNKWTVEAIVGGLLGKPAGFRKIGPLSWAGEKSSGKRGSEPSAGASSQSARPAVVLLPGMMGSNLKAGGRRVWLGSGVSDGLEELEYKPGSNAVEVDGLVEGVYDELIEALSRLHEVIPFPYDWRRPFVDAVPRLAAQIREAIEARKSSGAAVRIVAHSTGGLLARVLQLEEPELWSEMMQRRDARVLLLGTPNDGTWTPMQILSGDDSLGGLMPFAGDPFGDAAKRAVLAGFPGLLQAQAAVLDQTSGLAREDRWKQLGDDDRNRYRQQHPWHALDVQVETMRWGVPSQEVLNDAVALWTRLRSQSASDLGVGDGRVVVVAGEGETTIDGFERTPQGFAYTVVPEGGDGRVMLASALLAGAPAWRIRCEHGLLASRKDALEAYVELLERGTTGRLERLESVPRVTGRGTRVPGAPSRPGRRQSAPVPPESGIDVQRVERPHAPSDSDFAGAGLRVTVINGDLTFVQPPLLIGHYHSTRLTGAEWVIDRFLGGAMQASLARGLYPDPAGTHQVFMNRKPAASGLPRPQAVIVVGLGDEGNLSPSALIQTIRQGVLAWAERLNETEDPPATFELAATLIGSGGSRITVGQSAQLIVQGVCDANARLLETRRGERVPPRVASLSLIEIYADRATEAWRALRLQEESAPGRFVLKGEVVTGQGGLRRPLDSGYRGADYDFISAVSEVGLDGEHRIAYTLDTRRARTEVRAHKAQVPLLRELVLRASNAENRDTDIGRTLFQLLVPIEMEPFLAGRTEMVIELDGGTAGIPWELLDAEDARSEDRRPWAIRTKLLRKLRLEEFRPSVVDAGRGAGILVIGEPECDGSRYPRLAGARKEARAVVETLRASGIDPKAFISPEDGPRMGMDASTIVNALLSSDWRVVHVAGHGEPPLKIGPKSEDPCCDSRKDGDPRGVVLSNCAFLGPREIQSMRVVPELVFMNCCHLAARDVGQLLDAGTVRTSRFDRSRFAAGVAEALIDIGVRCVIAAGWAVDDAAAETFARVFYERLTGGDRFLDAVVAAREATWRLRGQTWAAYQCYGDPDWRFVANADRNEVPRGRRSREADRGPSKSHEDEFQNVAAPGTLKLVLDTLAVESEFQHAASELQQERLRRLESRFGTKWGDIGEIAESFGAAWRRAGDLDAAVRWYQRAVAANDGSASMKAAEQLGHLRVQRAFQAGRDARDRMRAPEKERRTRGRKRSPAAADASFPEKPAEAIIADAIDELKAAISFFEQLLAIQPTMEREALLGSAYKRLAELSEDSKQEGILLEMEEHYRCAEELGIRAKVDALYYPALNRMAAKLVLSAADEGTVELDSAISKEARESLERAVKHDASFASVASKIELDMYVALAGRQLANVHSDLEARFRELHGRIPDSGRWSSVVDQAHFVLPRYAKHHPVEKEAVDSLLALLDSFTPRRPS